MKQQDLFAIQSLEPRSQNDSTGAQTAELPSKGVNALQAPVVDSTETQDSMTSTVLSVSELTQRLKNLIEPAFVRVLVRGEVTGFRGPNVRGHLYFAVKDERASIDVRLWSSAARTLKFALKDGLAVIIAGALDVYAVQGRYSLIARNVEVDGIGARALAFEQLKAKLVAEGLLGGLRTKARKPLPLLPRHIGVVTSLSGAALRDFLKVLHRRHPRLPVLVAGTRVQGERVASEVVGAIQALAGTDVDVIVVTRGGGSVDDLWTFNEESVARAIFSAQVPVVSAVGHEIDTTLADLVADVRAPTPSAAAEAVAPVLTDLELQLAADRTRLLRAGERHVLIRGAHLAALKNKLGDPRRQLSSHKLWLSEIADRLTRLLHRSVREEGVYMKELVERLQVTRPLSQLAARHEVLDELRQRLVIASLRTLQSARQVMARLSLELERVSPWPMLGKARQSLDYDATCLKALARKRIRDEGQRLTGFVQRVDALNPLKVLNRGYAVASRITDGQVIRRASDAMAGDRLRLRLGEGELEAYVTGSTASKK